MRQLASYYALLDLEPGASPEEIRAAYRDLVQVWHPDRFAGNDRLRAKAEETLKRINEAYEKIRQAPSAAHSAYDPAPQEPEIERPSELEVLARGPLEWNLWRTKYSDITPSLAGANLASRPLEGIDLRECDLTRVNLERADLYKANLSRARLQSARLGGVLLHRAIAVEADFTGANLSEADLASADLRGAVFTSARLHGAQFIGAHLEGADLSAALGLMRRQLESSSIDSSTRLPASLR